MHQYFMALALCFTATVATADITFKVDQIGAGSVLVMKDRVSATTHVKRGPQGQLHVFDVYAGRGASANFVGSYKMDQMGNVVETIAMDGITTRFAPHNCARVIGECAYTVTHASGLVEHKTRVTTATRNGLRYTTYGLDGMETEGALGLDKLGLAQGGWLQDRGQKKLKHRLVAVALK